MLFVENVGHYYFYVDEFLNSGLGVDSATVVEVVSTVLDEEAKGELEFRGLMVRGLL